MKLLNRVFFIWFFVFICFWVCLLSADAQNCRLITDKGLRGEELLCLTVNPEEKNMFFVGTSRGLYVRLASEDAWQAVKGLPQGSCCVYQVIFEDQLGYIATSKGLFELDMNNFRCRNIFERSNDSERDCISVCVLKNGLIFAGTKSGLFTAKKGQRNWKKISTLFNDEEITCLAASDDMAYALTSSGIYRTQNSGKAWEKIFNKISYSEDYYETDEGDGEVEVTRGDVKYIAANTDNSSVIYAAAVSGVFLSEDKGNSWHRLPLTGLEYSDLRFIRVLTSIGKVVVVSKNNVYEFTGGQWQTVAGFYDCRQVDESADALIVLTGRDIFKCEIPSYKETVPGAGRNKEEVILKAFDNEPTVQEVQKKAIAYSETSNKKINDWRRRANVKAMLPKLTFGYDNNVYGSYNGNFAIGPNSWDVNVSWDLSELIYNSDQTTIDNRSKLMVQLRNDILAEVTSLFFERRRLQVELIVKDDLSAQDKLDKELRISELTALLDRLTGGFYSKSLQDVKNSK
ncbi:MAG: hypothetical protein ABIC68_02925 [Candidatus Omnitrophota bacterium]